MLMDLSNAGSRLQPDSKHRSDSSNPFHGELGQSKSNKRKRMRRMRNTPRTKTCDIDANPNLDSSIVKQTKMPKVDSSTRQDHVSFSPEVAGMKGISLFLYGYSFHLRLILKL
jgi:hypothetical protein